MYGLLRTAPAQSDRAGIATFVMRNKPYLTALRVEDEILALRDEPVDALAQAGAPKEEVRRLAIARSTRSSVPGRGTTGTA
ncbi:hypothetical protein [Streptomyces sp. CA-251247]|uniref:hypothetical protein n=1 Tax=Streptomyces sp. CA-251247 TaxID=3240062 RepID=UPI003D94E8FF